MKIKLRDMEFCRASVRNIKHVAMVPEVQQALMSWILHKATISEAPGVLIGGLAMSFYTKPRYTEDVDLLFLHQRDIPDSVVGFKKHRPGAFEERVTHVEIEVNTPESFHLPTHIAKKVFDTAVKHGDLLVASREGMVALKLCAAGTPKREYKDMADVVSLLESTDVDMSDWLLTDSQQARLYDARQRARE